MDRLFRIVVLCWLVIWGGSVWAGDYSKHPEFVKFIDEMVEKHGFERAELETLIGKAKKKQSILDAISRPAERTKTWEEYRPMFVNKTRIGRGVTFWKNNEETLKRAEAEYGVPAKYIVSIIGVETMYGKQGGGYRVIDALSTLAFDYPKRPLFRRELTSFLIMCRDYKLDPLTIRGSYAGAMGFGQFIPSSYLSYAVDFDGDDSKDIWANPVDAIGSVANYIQKHGWVRNGLITSRARVSGDAYQSIANESLEPTKTIKELVGYGVTPATDASLPDQEKAALFKYQGRLGAEFWLGFNNFYAITRYNHSRLYAMSVIQLGDEIERKRNSKDKKES
ncbi:lytic murein transglycosylase B [Litoribrevibacter albus]|uniref:Murein transglycosylase n=1 Tax=Litoribrevibacter albus TaxID=1473156 RepID=A0AA37SCK5_9GAMM|nr:lytic murein transglycosylase B [Litoribrevibacter albus]GLQ32453.1 murein transglycosylase [Litoribrevibacter albus]